MAHVVFVRQLFQGKLNADYTSSGAGPTSSRSRQEPTAPTASRPAAPSRDLRAADRRRHRSAPSPDEPFRESAQTVDLGSAQHHRLGRPRHQGAGQPPDGRRSWRRRWARELAASRPICDNGWLPMERQVGSSGQTVVAEALPRRRHLRRHPAPGRHEGLEDASSRSTRTPNAPIFEVADYGIVGDLFEVVPALTEAVKKAKGT